MNYKNLTIDNLESEHLCCAIADKKHQCGVDKKRQWLKDRISEGHIFRKLDANGKVFIEYAPLELAWTPIEGDNFIYIYCLWVSGSYKEKGYGKDLLTYCIDDAKKQGKSGVCILSSKKKKPYLSEKAFFLKFGFEVVDTMGEYELLSLSFDNTKPKFSDSVKIGTIENKNLTIYYSPQCPFTANCIDQVKNYCDRENIAVDFIPIITLEQSKNVPCVFNNWAVFMNGSFVSLQLMNEGAIHKLMNK